MTTINLRNTSITRLDVIMILRQANIVDRYPNNMDTYQRAFTHKSYCISKCNEVPIVSKLLHGQIGYQDNHYERLEFLGDSILSTVAVKYIYDRFTDCMEGELTRIKSHIVSGMYLSQFAKQFGFNKFILMSNSTENCYGRDNIGYLEDVYEAFVGALSIDMGIDIAKKFVLYSLDNYVNYAQILRVNTNYKDRILTYFQKCGWSHPTYTVISHIGTSDKRTFIVTINKMITRGGHGTPVCEGHGHTIKDAQQNASYNALKLFNQLESYELTSYITTTKE